MPAVSAHDLTKNSVVMYSIDYSTLDWSGNVHAYAITSAGAISTTDLWTGGASAQISAQNWDTGRKIVTLNGSNKIAFRWANLSGTQQSALANDSNILNYVRGDRSNEDPNGSAFRKRNTVLGDIIHSTPIYWEDPATYSSSGTATQSTQCSGLPCKTLFVGANDGMLHVLDATSGQERFAFIPSQLIPKLSSLSDTSYAHTLFVDGQMDIKLYGTQVVLAGALGGGGMGLYGLDVSNPNPASEAAAASKILWEISNATTGFADLGNVYGTPVLTKAQDGTAMVLVGNGYNNTGSGYAILYKINALTGAKVGEISTNSGSTASPNGLSTPTLVDTDLDGKADFAYAGDIDGNLWKFDLTANTATKLLTTSANQAITMAPAVMPHPKGGYMVVFVTGKLFTAADQTDTSTHYAYGVWDGAPASNSVTVSQTLTEQTYTSGTSAIRVRTATSTAPDWTTAKGWKTALPIGGERLLGGDNAIISQGVFRFLSSNPTVNPTSTIPGENWWVELDPLTGGSSGINRFDLNGDAAINSSDLLANNVPAVGVYMGGGIRSQLITLFTSSYSIYHANYDRNGAPPSPAVKGVAGGHFDVEFYKAPATVCTGETAGSSATKGAGSVKFNFGSNKLATYITIKVGTETVYSGSVSPSKSQSNLDDFLDGKGSANYTLQANYNGSSTTLGILATSTGAAYNGTVTVSITSNGSSPGYSSIVNVTGGTDATNPVTDSTTQCSYTQHKHEYDDIYDKTGINVLNPSVTSYKLSNAVTSTQQFKVLMMNQYLNPSVMLNIGHSDYDPASANGYIYIKDYQTASSLDVTTLPTYTLSTVGSLALNMPVDAFDIRDWWGNGDARNGLLPSSPQCIYYGTIDSSGNLTNSSLADMYTPVVPPANGTQGPATRATTSTAANAARHGGGLTLQIIKDTTPQSAIEQNVSGRPEYGYRVKQAYVYLYVLAEYTIFWHHPRRVCYDDSTTTWYNGSSGGNGFPTAASGAWNTAAKMTGTGWTKNAPEDTTSAAASQTPATGSTDPKLGSFASIAGVIGSSGSSGSGGTGSGGSSGDLYGVVTGGAVSSGTGGTGAGSLYQPPAGTPGCTGEGCFDLSGGKGNKLPPGRINWREVFR
ncbi:MAG: pilus assembly protein [Bacteroidota bacterium]